MDLHQSPIEIQLVRRHAGTVPLALGCSPLLGTGAAWSSGVVDRLLASAVDADPLSLDWFKLQSFKPMLAAGV